MKNIDLPFLENLGLTKNEAVIYNCLLQSGETIPAFIIKKTAIKRATVYKSLYSLVQKSLVAQSKKNKKIHFKPLSPTLLTTLAENRIRSVERSRADLQAIMPELTSQYILSVERPVVSTYEGIDGIKKVFNDIYDEKSEPVYGCVDLESANTAVPQLIIRELIPKRTKNKVMAKSILAKSSQTEELAKLDTKQLRESYLVDKETYPLPAEIDVYENKVALLSFAKGKFAGVIIQNADIATSLKSIFKLAFDRAKQLNSTDKA